MSGHSKWSQIRRQKAVSDGAKSRIFSRHARLISLESKKAGGVPSSPGLAAAIERARAANMPKDNIERAIARGLSKESGGLDSVLYEAYGPGGTAILVDTLTDNKNRTTPEIKHLLSKNGIEVAAPGAAAWAFTKMGTRFLPNQPLIEVVGEDEEKLVSILEALEEHPDVQEIFTNAVGYENTSD